MTLKKWLKYIDPIVDITIWTQDDDETPSYEGSVLDIPWTIVDSEIGRADPTDTDEPIYISITDKNGLMCPKIVANIILK